MTIHLSGPVEVEVQMADVCFRCSNCLVAGAIDATTTAELLSLYQEWQRLTAAKVGKNQVSYTSFCFFSFVWFKRHEIFQLLVYPVTTIQLILIFHLFFV